MMRHALAALLSLLLLAWMGPAAARDVQPLFASAEPLKIRLQAPLNRLVVNRAANAPAVDGTLEVLAPAAETLTVRLSVRGITRRASDICQFPPILVEFAAKPPSGSIFAGQKKLKLATHCKRDPAFQQHLLVEYGAYRMLNVLTPNSFDVRLATVDYQDPSGKLVAERYGYFIEDQGALAKRNGLAETKLGPRVDRTLLSRRDGARTALFEYLVGNLDWSMIAGPQGAHCCHNIKLLAPPGAAGPLVPVPYDYDFSGLVDAPYATPPDALGLPNVRTRMYRGYCLFAGDLAAVAAEFTAKREAMLAAFDATPGLEEPTRAKAHAFLAPAFDAFADGAGLQRVTRICVG